MLIVPVFTHCEAQVSVRPLSASYAGIGAYSIHHTDGFSFTANQASLARLINTSVAVSTEQRFLLTDIRHYSATIAVLTSSGNFGLQISHYGNPAYHESLFGLAYARSLGDNLDAGIQFNYTSIGISGYGSAGTIGFSIGSIMHISPQVHAGVQISNPLGMKFGADRSEKLPAVFRFGFGYEPSEEFFTGIEISKEENKPVDFNAGMQYKFLSQLFARAGISTATSSSWISIGILLKRYRLDVTAHYHPVSGFTPGLSFVFIFEKAKQ